MCSFSILLKTNPTVGDEKKGLDVQFVIRNSKICNYCRKEIAIKHKNDSFSTGQDEEHPMKILVFKTNHT